MSNFECLSIKRQCVCTSIHNDSCQCSARPQYINMLFRYRKSTCNHFHLERKSLHSKKSHFSLSKVYRSESVRGKHTTKLVLAGCRFERLFSERRGSAIGAETLRIGTFLTGAILFHQKKSEANAHGCHAASALICEYYCLCEAYSF